MLKFYAYVVKCNTVEYDPENNQVTPQSPCELIVKSSETMVVRIGKEREKETICQCASGVYHSERRPGLDPRFEVGVEPVVFPLSTTNYAAKSAFSVGNLHTSIGLPLLIPSSNVDPG